jgi:hypothetical protein
MDETYEAAVSPTSCGGFPTRAEFIEAYAKQTGFEVTNVDYESGRIPDR